MSLNLKPGDDLRKTPRHEPRPELMEDPRERAARRAAELRENIGSLDEGTDEFFIDPDVIPDGWSYQWKRAELMGKSDPAYDVSLRRRGWEEVPANRHPEMMPSGDHSKFITRKGMVLMERPKEIDDESRKIDARNASNQVRRKEEQLNAAPSGQFARANKDSPLVRVGKSFEPIPVPEK